MLFNKKLNIFLLNQIEFWEHEDHQEKNLKVGLLSFYLILYNWLLDFVILLQVIAPVNVLIFFSTFMKKVWSTNKITINLNFLLIFKVIFFKYFIFLSIINLKLTLRDCTIY